MSGVCVQHFTSSQYIRSMVLVVKSRKHAAETASDQISGHISCLHIHTDVEYINHWDFSKSLTTFVNLMANKLSMIMKN